MRAWRRDGIEPGDGWVVTRKGWEGAGEGRRAGESWWGWVEGGAWGEGRGEEKPRLFQRLTHGESR